MDALLAFERQRHGLTVEEPAIDEGVATQLFDMGHLHASQRHGAFGSSHHMFGSYPEGDSGSARVNGHRQTEPSSCQIEGGSAVVSACYFDIEKIHLGAADESGDELVERVVVELQR